MCLLTGASKSFLRIENILGNIVLPSQEKQCPVGLLKQVQLD